MVMDTGGGEEEGLCLAVDKQEMGEERGLDLEVGGDRGGLFWVVKAQGLALDVGREPGEAGSYLLVENEGPGE